MRSAIRTGLGALFGLTLAAPLWSQAAMAPAATPAPTEAGDTWILKQSPAVEAERIARTARIEAELSQTPDPDWAGEYGYGDGLGVNVTLLWAPRAGFVMTWHGCMGLYDINYGPVVRDGASLRLQFALPNDPNHFGFPSELVQVPWGPRHYLIPADRFMGFANDVNAGLEPALNGPSQSHLLMTRDRERGPAGKPVLPEPFQAYLLPTPVQARVIEVHWTAQRRMEPHFVTRGTLVRLDAGKAEGLRPGMQLFVTHPAHLSLWPAAVRTVDEHQCEVVIVQMRDHGYQKPKLGWRLSTRRP